MTKRYALVKIVSDSRVSNQQFDEALKASVRRYFGEIGFSRINPQVVRYDVSSSTGIVSCDREALKDLESAVALITKCSQEDVAAVVLQVSGTIKGLRSRVSRNLFH